MRRSTQCAYVGVMDRGSTEERRCRNGVRAYRQGEREHTHCNQHQLEERLIEERRAD